MPWGNSFLTTLPFNIGKQMEDVWSGGTSTVQAFYPSIIIASQSFQEVYRLERTKVNSHRGAAVNCYFGKGKGLVAIKNYTTNKFWVLQEIL